MTIHSRRGFVGLALATAAAATARDSASIGLATSATRAVPAQSFADAVGICTHPNWRKTVWGSGKWPAVLAETGVGHVRGKLGAGGVGRAALGDLRGFLDRGGKLCALVANSGPVFDLPLIRKNIDFLASNVGAGHLSAIEGANEYNSPSDRPPDWAPRLRAFSKWLHDTVRADRRLDGVPLVAPSIWGRLTSDYVATGDLGRNVDRGCLHYYTGGRRPTRMGGGILKDELGGILERSLKDAIRDASILAPRKPLWVTEFGYSVAGPGQPQSRHVVSEEAAAKYLLRGLLDMFGEGVERIFLYTLLDDRRSPPRYHGLADEKFRRRASFDAVKNLMDLIHDSGAPSGLSATLSYSLGGSGGIKRQLFQKRDGTFLLTLYQDVDSYDRSRRRNITVAPRAVELKLPSAAARIEVFTPTFDLKPRLRAANSNRIIVPVGDHVTVVRISV